MVSLFTTYKNLEHCLIWDTMPTKCSTYVKLIATKQQPSIRGHSFCICPQAFNLGNMWPRGLVITSAFG